MISYPKVEEYSRGITNSFSIVLHVVSYQEVERYSRVVAVKVDRLVPRHVARNDDEVMVEVTLILHKLLKVRHVPAKGGEWAHVEGKLEGEWENGT